MRRDFGKVLLTLRQSTGQAVLAKREIQSRPQEIPKQYQYFIHKKFYINLIFFLPDSGVCMQLKFNARGSQEPGAGRKGLSDTSGKEAVKIGSAPVVKVSERWLKCRDLSVG